MRCETSFVNILKVFYEVLSQISLNLKQFFDLQEGHNPSMAFQNGENMPNRPDNFCVDQNNNHNNNQGQNNNNNNFNNGENDNNNCGNSQNGNTCGHNGMNSNEKINQYQRRIFDAIDNGFAYNVSVTSENV